MAVSGNRHVLRRMLPAFLIVILFIYLINSSGRRIPLFGLEAPPQRRSSYRVLKDCSTPYDTLLGVASGIPAYSNCHRRWRSEARAYVTLALPHEIRKEPFHIGNQRQLSTGNCWDAAEYITRFYYLMRGLIFSYNALDVGEFWSTIEFSGADGRNRQYEAVELPNLKAVKTAKERKRLAPRFADVVVWLPNPERDLPDGHAAVVVHVEDDVETAGGEAQLREMQKEHVQPQLVYIAEQNFDNKYWEGKNYSRVLRFSWKNGNEMLLQDPGDYHIIGRIRAGKLMHDIADDDL
ncbi:hypothetical protein LSM04_006109 [Trypanosoma melophagium]|uniref:uncharacterized protein n=1 Tax=Trypanosoma melophagium TaxID=715481 RepID=UPI003519F447|nr:hypothetical protein LSM04_006109 [Trypanosoma melophagium]